jgi:hypothetical protein
MNTLNVIAYVACFSCIYEYPNCFLLLVVHSPIAMRTAPRLQAFDDTGGTRLRAPEDNGGTRLRAPDEAGGTRLRAPDEAGGTRLRAPDDTGARAYGHPMIRGHAPTGTR